MSSLGQDYIPCDYIDDDEPEVTSPYRDYYPIHDHDENLCIYTTQDVASAKNKECTDAQ